MCINPGVLDNFSNSEIHLQPRKIVKAGVTAKETKHELALLEARKRIEVKKDVTTQEATTCTKREGWISKHTRDRR